MAESLRRFQVLRYRQLIARRTRSLVFLCLLCQGEARAQTAAASITLDYAAVPSCPKAVEFEAMVVARLGYDPFSERAQKHVSVHIGSESAALDGRTEWRDAAGKWAGDQSFHMAGTDCLRLTQTMGLALAVQLQLLGDAFTDTESNSVATPEPTPEPPSSSVRESPKTSSSSNDPSSTSPTSNTTSLPPRPTFALGTGTGMGLGMSSTPILFGRLFGSLAWQHLSLELGAELSVPATTRRADGAGFSQQLLLVSGAGCLPLSPWKMCLLLNAGEVRMEGENIDHPTSARVPIVEAGVRLAFNQPFGRRLFLSAYLDGLSLLTRRTGSLDAVPVWTAPPFAAAVGLDAGLRFP